MGAEAAGSDRDQVPNATALERDLAFDNAGRSIEANITTNTAAMPTGTSHDMALRRGGAVLRRHGL